MCNDHQRLRYPQHQRQQHRLGQLFEVWVARAAVPARLHGQSFLVARQSRHQIWLRGSLRSLRRCVNGEPERHRELCDNLPAQTFWPGSIRLTSESVIIGNNTDLWREHWHAAFIQDTWRVTPRVTFSPGVRWEYVGSPHSTVNHMGIFNPNAVGGVVQVGPGLPVSTIDPSPKGQLLPSRWRRLGHLRQWQDGPARRNWPAGQLPIHEYGRRCVRSVRSDVVHRYALRQRAPAQYRRQSIRAASSGIFPNTQSSEAHATPLTWPSNNTSPIFPTGSAITSTSGPTCAPAQSSCSMLSVDPNFKYPKSVQWNVDVQRAITNSLTLDVAYVGVHGYDETHSVDLNEPALGSGWNPALQRKRFSQRAAWGCR